MNRRRFLNKTSAVVTVGAISIAGCLGSSNENEGQSDSGTNNSSSNSDTDTISATETSNNDPTSETRSNSQEPPEVWTEAGSISGDMTTAQSFEPIITNKGLPAVTGSVENIGGEATEPVVTIEFFGKCAKSMSVQTETLDSIEPAETTDFRIVYNGSKSEQIGRVGIRLGSDGTGKADVPTPEVKECSQNQDSSNQGTTSQGSTNKTYKIKNKKLNKENIPAVTGVIEHSGNREIDLEITAFFLDEDGDVLDKVTNYISVEPGQQKEFEIMGSGINPEAIEGFRVEAVRG